MMKVFGIPIKIEISFFVLAAFLASSRVSAPAFLLEWLLVVFSSILLHEFGHALAAQAFGLSPTIRLYAMGGLTAYGAEPKLTVAKRLIVSLSGPAIGFVAGGIVFLIGGVTLHSTSSLLVIITYHDLLWVNVGWGLFNLLPMLPLDGGSVLVAFEEGLLGRKNQVISHAISLLTALTVAFLALSAQRTWIGILGIWFAYSNGSFLFQTFQWWRDQKLEIQLNEARTAVNRKDTELALELIGKVRKKARTSQVKWEAARIFIFALIWQGKYEEAKKELGYLNVLYGGDPYLEGLIPFQQGDMKNALPLMRAAFSQEPRKDIGLMLNRALIAEGEFREALELCAHATPTEMKWSLAADLQAESFNHGDFEVAVQAGLLAYAEQPEPNTAYNIGCAFARLANPVEAFKWISCAIDSGFDQKELLLSDPDLDPLRSMPGFKELLVDL